MDVVVMIRHPAAFCSSIKIKKWVFDWTHWSRQTELMDTLLAPFKSDIEKKQKQESVDLVDQAVLQWRIFHHVIDVYRKTRPDWSFVRHEDLSLDPVGGFKRMFDHCHLTWNDHCAQTVRESSDEGNLKDAPSPARARTTCSSTAPRTSRTGKNGCRPRRSSKSAKAPKTCHRCFTTIRIGPERSHIRLLASSAVFAGERCRTLRTSQTDRSHRLKQNARMVCNEPCGTFLI